MNLLSWAILVGIAMTLAVWGFRRLQKPKRAYTVKWIRRAPPPAHLSVPIPASHYRVRNLITGETRDIRISDRKR